MSRSTEKWFGEVQVVRKTDKAMLLRYEDDEQWVPESLIDDDSEIWLKSVEGESGNLVIPFWKAEQLGWT